VEVEKLIRGELQLIVERRKKERTYSDKNYHKKIEDKWF